MNKVDTLIAETIGAEERAFLDELANEPGYFHQAFGMFRGSTGWVSWVMMIAQTLMFLAGVWMAVNFFAADNSVDQLRWGLPAATILIIGGMLKMSLMPVMQANRVLRELRRLELVIAASKG